MRILPFFLLFWVVNVYSCRRWQVTYVMWQQQKSVSYLSQKWKKRANVHRHNKRAWFTIKRRLILYDIFLKSIMHSKISDVERNIRWVGKVKVIICTYRPIFSCFVLSLVRLQLSLHPTATKETTNILCDMPSYNMIFTLCFKMIIPNYELFKADRFWWRKSLFKFFKINKTGLSIMTSCLQLETT